MKLIIHAGMPKTASTSLQGAVATHANELLRHGVLYPGVGRWGVAPTSHTGLVLRAASTRWPPWADEYPLPVELAAELVMAEVELTGAHTVVLSSEYLWSEYLFGDVELERVASAFRAAEVVMLVALREPIKYLASQYAQGISGPRRVSHDFDHNVTRTSIDYVARLRTFETVGRVRPYWFEDVLPVSLGAPLASLLGVDVALFDQFPRNNRRMLWPLLRVLRRLNAVHSSAPRLPQLGRSVLIRADRLARRVPFADALDRHFSPVRVTTSLRQEAADVVDEVNREYDCTWWRPDGPTSR